jgi:hypothetical protein
MDWRGGRWIIPVVGPLKARAMSTGCNRDAQNLVVAVLDEPLQSVFLVFAFG